MTQIPHQLHSKEEIVNHFPNLPILQIWHTAKYWQMKYNEVEELYQNDKITLAEWDAYRAIWRNSVPRLSGTAIGFEF